jgi:glycosyltransferase involved in cell wall biosynthesis
MANRTNVCKDKLEAVCYNGVMSARAHIALNAHLLSGAASYRTAGIHGYLFNTLSHLPGVAPDLAYTLFVGKGQLPVSAKWAVRRSSLPTENPAIRIVWEQVLAPFELARVQPDLLHGMAFAVPLLWRGPSVITIFDLSFLRYPQRLSIGRRYYLRAMTRVSAHRARRVIAISECSRSEICSLLDISPEKVDVALPGVTQDFRPLPAKQVSNFRSEHRLPERFILYVGTIEPRKNLDTLIKAYAQLPERKAVKLVLAGGKGWQSERLNALIEELGLAQDVITTGYVSNNELPLWYNASEVFVYPSVYEGFGMPVLESMASGRPIIVSDSSSLPEVVGSSGILVPPTDTAAWSDALSTLLADPTLRSELADRGKERARRFTWENTARATVETYHKALDGKP